MDAGPAAVIDLPHHYVIVRVATFRILPFNVNLAILYALVAQDLLLTVTPVKMVFQLQIVLAVWEPTYQTTNVSPALLIALNAIVLNVCSAKTHQANHHNANLALQNVLHAVILFAQLALIQE